MTLICEEHERILDPEEADCVLCELDRMFMIEQAARRALDLLNFLTILAPETGSHDAVSGTIEELERALGRNK